MPNDLGARVYNIRTFGAKGDGSSLDTPSVQAAIDACNRDGGGTVLVPAGDFLVGTISLKSNVALRIASSGRLLGSADIAHYHPVDGAQRANGSVVLLTATDAENISVEGSGTIDGQGAKFYTGHGDATGPGDDRSRAYVHRPHLIVFFRCKNVTLRDVFCTASAYHCLRLDDCERVKVDGLRIHNRVNVNNDGIHLQSSRYVEIMNCDVACQDDACALFGSCQFITVTNSTFSTRWSVFRFGGGEAMNIAVSNCLIYETYGCPIKLNFGGNSRAENITFSNLVMRDVTGPINIGIDNRSRRRWEAGASPHRTPGVIRNISFHGIRAIVSAAVRQQADMPFPPKGRPGEQRTCIVLNGAGGAVLENISLSDVHVIYEGGGTAEEAARRDVPQIAGEYFEIGTPPAYGIYARGVRGLTLDNVRLETSRPDLRPAVVFDNVVDAAVSGLAVQGGEGTESTLRLIESRDLSLSAPRVLTPARVFLQVEGSTSSGITVDGGDLTKAASRLNISRGANESAVALRT